MSTILGILVKHDKLFTCPLCLDGGDFRKGIILGEVKSDRVLGYARDDPKRRNTPPTVAPLPFFEVVAKIFAYFRRQRKGKKLQAQVLASYLEAFNLVLIQENRELDPMNFPGVGKLDLVHVERLTKNGTWYVLKFQGISDVTVMRRGNSQPAPAKVLDVLDLGDFTDNLRETFPKFAQALAHKINKNKTMQKQENADFLLDRVSQVFSQDLITLAQTACPNLERVHIKNLAKTKSEDGDGFKRRILAMTDIMEEIHKYCGGKSSDEEKAPPPRPPPGPPPKDEASYWPARKQHSSGGSSSQYWQEQPWQSGSGSSSQYWQEQPWQSGGGSSWQSWQEPPWKSGGGSSWQSWKDQPWKDQSWQADSYWNQQLMKFCDEDSSADEESEEIIAEWDQDPNGNWWFKNRIGEWERMREPRR